MPEQKEKDRLANYILLADIVKRNTRTLMKVFI